MNTHTYATNSPFHPRLIAFIAFIAVGVSTGVGWVSSWAQKSWGYSAGGVSAMTAFGALFFIFNRWLWKLKCLRQLLLVPNLNGQWKVTGHTVRRDGEAVDYSWQGSITIVQSWSRIAIVLRTDQSASRSIAASLYRYPGEGYRLLYHYSNEPKADLAELQRHCGLCDLMFSTDLGSAEGSYFTDSDRLTVGTMKLHREDTHNDAA